EPPEGDGRGRGHAAANGSKCGTAEPSREERPDPPRQPRHGQARPPPRRPRMTEAVAAPPVHAERVASGAASGTWDPAVSDVLREVAHDFNNVMSAIIGYADLVLMSQPMSHI